MMKPLIDPPGPRGWPLVGVALQFRRDPLALLLNAVREYGDVVQLPLLRLPLTPLEPKNRLYIVNEPALVRHICLTNREKYRTHQQLVDKLKLVLDLDRGELLTSVGEEWTQRKTTLQPAFSGLTSSEVILRSVSAMLNRWEQFADGTTIDVDSEMTGMVTYLFASLFVGLDLVCEDRALAPDWSGMLAGFSRRMATPLKLLLHAPTGANREFHRCLGAVEKRLYATIADHKRCPRRYNDLLSAWLETSAAKGAGEASDKSIRDQVMLLLLAGRKNVSNALVWACHLLSMHPEAAERISSEAAVAPCHQPISPDDWKRAPFVAAVQKEVLRLYPTAWLIARRCLEDDNLGGYRIPRGATIFISPYAMHRNPKLWTDPEKFQPERFLDESGRRITPDMYLPFGVGPRTCIGNSLTEVIMRITIALIMQRFKFEPVPGHSVRIKAASSLSPYGGLPLVLRKRGSDSGMSRGSRATSGTQKSTGNDDARHAV
jgi:cytochrome P450